MNDTNRMTHDHIYFAVNNNHNFPEFMTEKKHFCTQFPVCL